MKYTIKDLKEGKCAVINDGMIKELRKVIDLAFPNSGSIKGGGNVYYSSDETTKGWECNYIGNGLPTQSVKDFLVETNYKGKAVHCITQEQWDYVFTKYPGRTYYGKSIIEGDGRLLGLKNLTHDIPDGTGFRDYQVLSFQEWLDENGYTFEDKPKFIEGTWYESDCGNYYARYTNALKDRYLKDGWQCTHYIYQNKLNQVGNFSRARSFSKVKLAPMEEVSKYLPNKVSGLRQQLDTHSYKDYKEGDYVVITEYKGKTDWKHWFMPGEVLKLGGRYWEKSLLSQFRACSMVHPKGNGMPRSFEENYKIRKATQEEIDNSQWGIKKISVDIESTDTIEIYKQMKSGLISLEDVVTKPIKLEVKLRNKRIKIKL